MWTARDTVADRAVVVVQLDESASETARARFALHAEKAPAITHPNVVRVLDHGVDADGISFLVCERLEGESLAVRMLEGPLAIGQAVDFAASIADGLAALHAAGFAHGDVEPGNVFLHTEGGAEIAKLIGLGVNRAHVRSGGDGDEDERTSLATINQICAYAAPEQVLGTTVASPEGDLYSLAATLYAVLTGRPPHVQKSLDKLLDAIRAEKPPSVRDIDRDLAPFAATFERALSIEPKRRFPDATSFARALRASMSMSRRIASKVVPTGRRSPIGTPLAAPAAATSATPRPPLVPMPAAMPRPKPAAAAPARALAASDDVPTVDALARSKDDAPASVVSEDPLDAASTDGARAAAPRRDDVSADGAREDAVREPSDSAPSEDAPTASRAADDDAREPQDSAPSEDALTASDSTDEDSAPSDDAPADARTTEADARAAGDDAPSDGDAAASADERAAARVSAEAIPVASGEIELVTESEPPRAIGSGELEIVSDAGRTPRVSGEVVAIGSGELEIVSDAARPSPPRRDVPPPPPKRSVAPPPRPAWHVPVGIAAVAVVLLGIYALRSGSSAPPADPPPEIAPSAEPSHVAVDPPPSARVDAEDEPPPPVPADSRPIDVPPPPPAPLPAPVAPAVRPPATPIAPPTTVRAPTAPRDPAPRAATTTPRIATTAPRTTAPRTTAPRTTAPRTATTAPRTTTTAPRTATTAPRAATTTPPPRDPAPATRGSRPTVVTDPGF